MIDPLRDALDTLIAQWIESSDFNLNRRQYNELAWTAVGTEQRRMAEEVRFILRSHPEQGREPDPAAIYEALLAKDPRRENDHGGYENTYLLCGADVRDALKEAADLGRVAAQEPQWHPIESAPTDGSEVYVYAAECDGLPPFITVAAYHPDAGWCVDELRTVTHWMPKTSTSGNITGAAQEPSRLREQDEEDLRWAVSVAFPNVHKTREHLQALIGKLLVRSVTPQELKP